ncbi:MAG: peptidoglycan-binding domain-containing protein [bacterium]|nr:peptidoglycan-binding domain-containing protein [bacterium]
MNSIKHKTARKITSVLLSATTMVWLAGASAFVPMVASADAATDALIASLQAQIASLMAQVAALAGSQSSQSVACSFTRDLTINATGPDVTCLQNYLTSTGHFTFSGGATGFFGTITRSAVAQWQAANGVAPAVGYFGAISRAKYASMASVIPPGPTPVPTIVPVTGGTLRVQLASDSPNNVALVAGQAIGELARFVFSNGSTAPVKVTTLNFKRIGSSGDSTLSNVYLYNGAVRLTDAAGVSGTLFSYNDTAGIFDVPAGGVVVVSVRSDILAGTAGQQVGAQLLSVVSNGTLDSSVLLPITGGLQSISSAAIGTVVVTYTGPTGTTENPNTDVRVFEGSAVIGVHAANLESIAFENRGTTKDGDLTNLKLFVGGVQVGSTVAQFVNKRATFDLSSAPVRLETGTRIIKLTADVVGGSSWTYDVQIRRAADMRAVDVELGQPILVTDADATFPVSAAAANTVAAGTLSLVRKTTSPSGSVAVGSGNVLWGTFEFRAAGEDVKIETITVDVDTTLGVGMDNGKVFLNGVQVGSTKDIVEAGTTEFTFGSSFIAKAGQVMTVDIYGDAKTTAAVNYANGDTVDVGISVAVANTERLTSGTPIASAISEVESFSRSMSSSSVTVNKASGYGNQTMIAGTTGAKLGSFNITAGSAEGINLNSIVVDMTEAAAASITDLMLKDSATGLQIGSTKPAPSTSNSFSTSLALAKSATVSIDVYANIKSSADAGTILFTVDSTTGGTGALTAQSATSGTDKDLQTITLAGAVLTGAVGSSNPNSSNAIAGQSDVLVGSFDFTSQYSDFTVTKVKVKVPANAATSVSSVKLKWTGGEASAVLALSSGVQTHATATFGGLTFPIAKNTTQKLDVYVSLSTIADGASTGSAVSVSLDGDEGYEAKDSAGNLDTTLTGSTADLSSNASAGKGVKIVRKSVPTLSAVALDSSALTAGTDKVLARVAVAADAAGDVGWKYLSFTVNKSAGVTIGATTTVKLYQGGVVVPGNFATSSAANDGTTYTAGVESFLAAVTSGNLVFEATTEEQIGAGSSKTYELRGTTAFDTDGDNLDISIANPTTSVSTDIYATVLGTFGDATPSLIWTDRSSISTVHSEATSDWTNDYLVKTLPLTVGSKTGNL